MEEELYITNLIDVSILQTMQDAFCKMTGIAAGISDANGVAVTKPTIASDFCWKLTKESPVGRSRCERCDKQGGKLALKKGTCVAYECHAGLIDFAAPIMARGKMIGCFIGGQVLIEPANEEKIIKVAEELDIDPEIYLDAVRQINIVEEEEIIKAGEFIYTITNILSDIAYNKYLTIQANTEIERAAKMKSDFLANMSHEIRTPMNAVIGMAEMALREELSPVARDYINQIQSSGRTLLAIINDILDFSKIESGKMDIMMTEYEPMSIVNDVEHVIITRLGDKDVELILDIVPDLPYKLLGDYTRIEQIIINLANNAVKFTKHGKVVLKMDYVKKSADEIYLQICVQDTGIGIKKEDLEKLFQSFQQLDSKRNRNIEGTGLGLAISKQLVTLMNGQIWVESEYEKGSKFFVVIPQKIIDSKPSIILKEQEPIITAGLISRSYLKPQIKVDIGRLGVKYIELHSEEELNTIVGQKVKYFFVGYRMFTVKVQEFIRSHPEITGILMIAFNSSVHFDIPNLMIVKRPLYILNIAEIFNHDKILTEVETNEGGHFDFIAPDAEILIVDDNAINLTVAEGLLRPLQMKIETAASGKETIDKISTKKYDLIFMDHMMPEIDGVETTHIIRRFHEEYSEVPIIALTANAVDGTRQMFIEEGMNDFVPKPIEIKTITSKLYYWLPKEKIKRVYKKKEEEEKEKIEIEGLDTEEALRLLGDEALFWSVLKDYYKVIERKTKIIKEYEEKEQWHEYTIEVHALKSASRQIGAMELAKKAEAMEAAGNARNGELIHQCTDEMLLQYQHYYQVLQPYFVEKKLPEGTKIPITFEVLSECFEHMKDAMEELDMDRMEKVIQEMEQYSYTDWQKEMFEQLREAVDNIDIDTCEEILDSWGGKMQ